MSCRPPLTDHVASFMGLVHQLHHIVASLKSLYPKQTFAIDGLLMGSIGEVAAALAYDLELLPRNTPVVDAVAPDGRQVQVKLTARKSIVLPCQGPTPELLLVLRHDAEQGFSEEYNGPFPLDLWCQKRNGRKSGKPIRFGLRALNRHPGNIRALQESREFGLERLNGIFLDQARGAAFASPTHHGPATIL